MKKFTIFLILFFVFNFLFSDFVFAQTIPSCPIPRPTLSRGSRGDCVRFLQNRLNTLIGAGLVEDGIFGSATEITVVDYQQLNNLRRVDGIVGPETWDAISRGLTGQQPQPPSQPQPPTQQAPGYSLPPLPLGTGLTTGGITGLLIRFANFLIGAGIVLAIITIVVSGLMFFWAKSDTEAKKAKGWFRNGLIGAFIILAVGVIILTIYNIVVTGTFFGGPIIPGPGPGPVVPPPGGPGPGPVSGGPGSPCVNNSQCMSSTTCDTVSNICVRNTGNLEGELCKGDGDCNPSLRCKGRIFGRGQKTCKKP